MVEVKERFNFKSIDRKDRWVDPLGQVLLEGRHLVYPNQPLVNTRLATRLQHLGSGQYVEAPSIVQGKAAVALDTIQRFRGGIAYYGASQFTNPTLCPTSFEIDSDGDLRDAPIRGVEHVRFMYDLYQLYVTESDAYSNYIGLVGKEGVRLIDKITWKRSTAASNTYEVRSGGKIFKKKRDTILIIPTVHSGKTQLSFNQLSEGTFRSLAMLFYISTSKSSLLLIEEPEVCVHHGLLASFVEIIKQYSQRKQIIVSTHSDYVIDKLKPENVFIVRNDRRRGTTVKPIPRAMSQQQYAALKQYLDASGNLGEYWRHSGFE